MKDLKPGDLVEVNGAQQRTERRVEWVSDDGQRFRLRWTARP